MNIARHGMKLLTAVALMATITGSATQPVLAPIPAGPPPQAQDSVPMEE